MLRDIPIKMVGSSIFNKFPEISSETTTNMLISDNSLVGYPGYKKIYTDESTTNPIKIGRAIYNCSRINALFAVIGKNIFKITDLSIDLIYSNYSESNSRVYIAENTAGQVLFCDSGVSNSFLIYNIKTNQFETFAPYFTPIYIISQDGYFIAAASDGTWCLSKLNDAKSWNALDIMYLSVEPDSVRGIVRLPSRGGQILVIGEECTESWTDTGNKEFPYERNTGYSIDYGCISPETIAYSEEIVAWLGVNKHSNPTIMYSVGAEAIPLLSDGINSKLEQLYSPESAIGFFLRVYGHLIYQITFPHKNDNFSLIYDFTNKAFFNITDFNYNCHPARHIEVYRDKYYFITHNNGSIYRLDSKYTTYDGDIIPRYRICNNFMLDNGSRFIIDYLTFFANPSPNTNSLTVDLSISKNSGNTYGASFRKTVNNLQGTSRFMFRKLGSSNKLTVKLCFLTSSDIIINGGIMGIRK